MTAATHGRIGAESITVTLTDDGQVLPAPGAGKRYRIFALVISSLLATNVQFQSASTQISNLFYLPATGGAVLPAVELAWFRTNPNEALNLEMSTPTSVSVMVIYDLVDY